jgi:hypothetical protein
MAKGCKDGAMAKSSNTTGAGAAGSANSSRVITGGGAGASRSTGSSTANPLMSHSEQKQKGKV